MPDDVQETTSPESAGPGPAPATPEVPARTSSTAGDAQAGSPGAKPGTGEVATGQAPDPYEGIERLDPKILRARHPQLRDSIAGEWGEREQRIRADERERFAVAQKRDHDKAEADRLEKKRLDDPFGYAEEMGQIGADERRQRELDTHGATIATSIVSELDGHLHSLVDLVPPEKRSVFQKEYGSDINARAMFVRDAMETYADHKVAEARAKWNHEDRAALEAQIRDEQTRGARRIDTGSGVPVGSSFNPSTPNEVYDAIGSGDLTTAQGRRFLAELAAR